MDDSHQAKPNTQDLQPETGPPVPDAAAHANTVRLTCRWCAITLPAGETVCPQCGSTATANQDMIVPGLSTFVDEDPPAVNVQPQAEPEEWWKDEAEPSVYQNSAQNEAETIPTILIIIGSVVICMVLGVLAAPLLAPILEDNLGVVIEHPTDLRPLGGMLGLLTGLFIGTIVMWFNTPRR